jgi:hypothetical protein
MKIETKYSIGDTAFVMHNNRAYYSSDISSIDGMVRFEEKYVFKTKEDLLKTL